MSLDNYSTLRPSETYSGLAHEILLLIIYTKPPINTHADGMSKFWSEASSTSILCVFEQRRRW